MGEPESVGEPTQTRRAGMRELRADLAGFLRQARQGVLRSKIRMAPDFGALPPEVLEGGEG